MKPKILQLQKEMKDRLINIKVSAREMVAIEKKAEQWTDGNVSAWIRFAAICLDPDKRHLVANDNNKRGA